MIRRARTDDLNRIAEIEVFNYRLKFYPIFLDDEFYFGELQVPNVAGGIAIRWRISGSGMTVL